MSSRQFAGGALIAGIIVAASFAIVAFAIPRHFKVDLGSFENRLFRVERQSLSRTDAPAIVFLGSSRGAFGVESRAIEVELGLPARSVANAAFPGLYDEALEQFVDRNLGYLNKAKTVVLIVDDNAALYPPSQPAAAPSNEGVSLSSLLAGAQDIIRTWPRPVKAWNDSLSRMLPDFRRELYWSARQGREAIGKVHREYLWSLSESGRWEWPSINTVVFVETANEAAVSKAVADMYFANRVLIDRYVTIYERIVRKLGDTQVVVLQMPSAVSYSTYRDVTHGRLHRAQRQAFEELFAKLGVPVLRCEPAAACGLSDRIFGDPLHLNAEGARQLSTAFARMLRDRQLVH